MSKEPQVVVIGGGIVGLATALALTEGERPVAPLVLEKEHDLATHQTGHNSGVIHSGLYYRPDSLKARFTVAGAHRLVEFCRTHDIPHEICGKVVVATNATELPRLEELYRRGRTNGVPGLELIGPERLREIEPHAAGIKALRVPGSGIVDFTTVTHRYAALIRERGGEVRTGAKVTGIRRVNAGWGLDTTAGTIHAAHLINCAGLHSDRIAGRAGVRSAVRIVPFRGEYYCLAAPRRDLVKHLIYPVPDPAFPFLGVHFTRTIDGVVEAGPNAVLGLKREGYRKTDFSLRDTWSSLSFPGFWRMAARYGRTGLGEAYRSFNKRAFVRALRRLLPEIEKADLDRGGSGVRAQAVSVEGLLLDDFCIETGENAVHVLNAPSPAATASLPIGEAVAQRARRHFGWSPQS